MEQSSSSTPPRREAGGDRSCQRTAEPGGGTAEPVVGALFAGTLSQPLPGTPMGDLFRLGDRLREFRGDSHIAAWVAAGLDGVEIGLLTEPYWGMPRTYIRTRAWSDEPRRRPGAPAGGWSHRRSRGPDRAGGASGAGDRADDRRPDGPRRRLARRGPRGADRPRHPLGPPDDARRRLPRAPWRSRRSRRSDVEEAADRDAEPIAPIRTATPTTKMLVMKRFPSVITKPWKIGRTRSSDSSSMKGRTRNVMNPTATAAPRRPWMMPSTMNGPG